MSRVKKALFCVLGVICLVLGTIGIVLPILPTTPLYLAAAALLATGSDRLHNWFIGTKVYEKHVGPFIQNPSMTMRSKIISFAGISALLALALWGIWHVFAMRIVIGCVWVFHIWLFFVKIKTSKPISEKNGTL